MRSCVQCDAIFDGEPITCPVCGTPTVDEAVRAGFDRIAADLRAEALVPVYTFDGPADRAILLDLFRQLGIPHAAGGAPLLHAGSAVGDGWGDLLVPEDSVARARQVLRDYANDAGARST